MKKKYFLAIIFTAALICIWFRAGHTIYAEKKEPDIIKVGYIPNYGMGSQAYDGMGGYTYSYLAELSQYTGWSYEFVECSGTNYFQKLQDGEIDLIGPVQFSKERSEFLDYSALQMDYGFQNLVTYDNRDIYYEDFDHFDGMTVGVTHGSFYKEVLEDYCREHGFSVNILETDGVDIPEKINSGTVDAMVVTSLLYIPHIKAIARLDTVPFYFASSKQSPGIMQELNRAMARMFEKNPYFASGLHEKYYKEAVSTASFTREEAAFIRSAGPLRVVCEPDWAPYEQWDSKAKTYEGINIDILNKIAEESGLQFTYIKTDSYEEAIDYMKSGKADLLLRNVMEADEYEYFATQDYLELPCILAGTRAVDTGSPLSVAMPNLTSSLSRKLMRMYPAFYYVDYGSPQNVIQALLKGKEDLALIDLYSFNETVRKESTKVYFTVPLELYQPLNIGLSAEMDPKLVQILNTAIDRIDAEEISAVISEQTMKKGYRFSFKIFLDENISVVLCGTLGLFFVIILAILASTSSRRHAIEKVAYVDSLTGLPTFEKFKLDIAEVLKNSWPGEYMILSIDINGFKYINDTFGYDTGNKLLQAMGQKFMAHEGKGTFVCRVSADNFYVMCRSLSLEKLTELFGQTDYIGDDLEILHASDYPVTFCAGACVVDNPAEDLLWLSDNANLARKSVKGHHSNNIAFYNKNMEEVLKRNKEITMSMDHALKRHEFEIYLQPKISLQTGSIAGAEALVRWNNPNRGILPPDSFIPLFEQNGFIQKLDFYMFEEVCRLLHRWEEEKGLSIGPVSVNLSRCCLNYPNLGETLRKLAQKHGVDPSGIEIELTETIVMNSIDELVSMMMKIKQIGFQISLDDFGSGYSSLNLLPKLPADIVKIDKVFLGDTYGAAGGKEFVGRIIGLVRTLGMKTVMEGVETQEQMESLRGFGCDIGQGFLFARPLPVNEFEKLYIWKCAACEETL